MWSNKLSDEITKLNVRNERAIAMEIDLDKKYCFINVYMPTNKNDSENSYRECLDVLHAIISRFESSHKIALVWGAKWNIHVNKTATRTDGSFCHGQKIQNVNHRESYYLFGTNLFDKKYIITRVVLKVRGHF